MATAVEPVSTRPLTERPAWNALQIHSKKIHKEHLREFFAPDSERGTRMANLHHAGNNDERSHGARLVAQGPRR